MVENFISEKIPNGKYTLDNKYNKINYRIKCLLNIALLGKFIIISQNNPQYLNSNSYRYLHTKKKI